MSAPRSNGARQNSSRVLRSRINAAANLENCFLGHSLTPDKAWEAKIRSSNSSPKAGPAALTLAVLEALSGPRLAILLALSHPRVPRQQAICFQGGTQI